MEAVSEISQQRISLLYPPLRPTAFRVCQDVYRLTGRAVNVVQGIRSFDEQFKIYSEGRELVDGVWKVIDAGKVISNARPGLSWHCYGLAFDVAWAGEDPYLSQVCAANRAALWNMYGKIGKQWGLTWGGDFHLINGVNDLPHLESTYGLRIEQALELYDHGGVPSVWAYLDKIRNA